MMVTLGNFLFRYRNGLFPVAYGLLILDSHRVFDHTLSAALIGFVVAALGQLLRALTVGLVYIVRGGRHRRVYASQLVTEGVFAHCRNPLYVGNLLIIAGVAIAADSLLFAAVGIPFFFIAYRAIVAAEEAYLRDRFGREYEEYCSKVNRFIPDFSGFRDTLRGMAFNWKRLLLKEYGSMFTWSAGMILVVARNTWMHTGYEAGRRVIWTSCFLLILVTLGFATARILKKSHILQAD
jgi:protein-S-isoprenylcysteine O-methyltransferase Ste14